MTRANQVVAGDAKQNLNLGANLLPKLLRDRDRDRDACKATRSRSRSNLQ